MSTTGQKAMSSMNRVTAPRCDACPWTWRKEGCGPEYAHVPIYFISQDVPTRRVSQECNHHSDGIRYAVVPGTFHWSFVGDQANEHHRNSGYGAQGPKDRIVPAIRLQAEFSAQVPTQNSHHCLYNDQAQSTLEFPSACDGGPLLSCRIAQGAVSRVKHSCRLSVN